MIKMLKKGEGNSKRIFVVVFLLFLIILFSGSFYTIFTERSTDKGCFAGDEAAAKIDVDQILIKVLIKSKEFLNRTIRVMNIGDDISNIEIMVKGVEDIVSVSDNSFILKSGQTKRVDTTFSTINREKGIEHRPDVYIGKLEVVSAGVVKTVPLIVEIESKNILYDMNLNPLARGRVIYPGEKVTIEVKLFNLEDLKPVNIDMEYFVRDLEGNTIISESETVVVQNQASFFKTISIPNNFRSENYVFIALAKYGTSTGTASYLFEVSGVKEVAKVEEGGRKFFEISKLCNNDPFCWISFYVIILLFLALGGSIYFFVGGWIYNKINSIFSNRYRKKVIVDKENEITERERKQKEIIELKKFEMELESKEKESKRRRVRDFMHTIGVYKTEEEREEIRNEKGKERDRRKREKRLKKKEKEEERLGRKKERERRWRERRLEMERRNEERLERKKEREKEKEDNFRDRRRLKKEREELKINGEKRKEREKRRREESARKYGTTDSRKRKRVERIHGIMHAFGLYKTKEELREERKRKRVNDTERKRKEEKKAKGRRAEEEIRKRKERKKNEIERERKRKEEEKKRKRELKLKKKLGKSIALFNVLTKKADKFVGERKLGRVISCYSRMKYVYDKLKIVPLESEGKRDVYSKLSDVYVWICNEKEAKEKEREVKRRKKLGMISKRDEREEEKRKQEEIRKQVEEEKRMEEVRKREEERKRREEERKGQEEVRERKIREVRNRGEEKIKLGERKRLEEEKRKSIEEQRQREEEQKKRDEEEGRKREKERKRLEEEKKRQEEIKKDIERKKTEEAGERREARRRKRKKEFRNILHGIGLYETEEEKRKRLREIKRKNEERERIEVVKRREEEKRKRLEEEKKRKREALRKKEKEKIRKEEIERYIEKKKIIEERLKKKREKKRKEVEKKLKRRKALRRKVEMFNKVFLEVKDRIKKEDVDGAVDSYERLKLKYNELVLSSFNKGNKAGLYNKIREAYGLLAEERQRKINEEMKVQRLALTSLEKEKEKGRKRGKREKGETKKSVETSRKKKKWLWGREKDPKTTLHKEHREIEDARTTSGTNSVGEEEMLRRQEAELEKKEKEQLKKLEELMKNG
ncbi:MAG: hypothetical protein QF506_03605 [Candidatus Woesearchaeota archaeon]|jgi:hypothetical protein|nr:hypothetical protein [Candidatus Woesearchaeota archaeon]